MESHFDFPKRGRSVRTVSVFQMQGQSSPPAFQYCRVPRVGNLIGGIALRLKDALIPTTQSSILEIYVSVRLDGEALPVEIEIEDFYYKLED